MGLLVAAPESAEACGVQRAVAPGVCHVGMSEDFCHITGRDAFPIRQRIASRVPEHGRVNPQAPESRRFAEPREHLTEASGRERAAAFAHVALIFPEIWGFAERPEARTAASSKLDFVVSGGRCIHETPYIPHTTRLSDQRTRQMAMATPPRLDVRRCACACSVFRPVGFPLVGSFCG